MRSRRARVGVLGVLGIAVEDAAGGRQAVAEDVEDVLARLAVVDDDGQVEAGGEVELVDEELDLALAVAEFVEVVEADLAQGDDAGELDGFLDRAAPVLAGILDLGGGDADGMEDVLHGLEVLVDLLEVHEAVADADDPRDAGLLRLLAN